jgi:predicted 2-oxoglutarate/Fe(II)-dependent dioxygenase YbiX
MLACSLLTPTTCKEIITRTRRWRWVEAQIQEERADGSERTYTHPKTRSARILNSPGSAELYEEFERVVRRRLVPPVKEFWDLALTEQSGTQLIRYTKGGHYHPHSDSGGQLSERYLSVVCYLNDDFEGGHTSFPSLNTSVAPHAGHAIVFPSQYIHCAEPVIRGEKFVFITWLCGPIQIAWI